MANYLAQCKHKVRQNDIHCKICGKKIERIWNIEELGIDNAIKLANNWNTSLKPKDLFEKRIIPYERDECIYVMCSAWDDANPNADENVRMEAFKNIVSNIYREEYNRSIEKDYHKYYGLLYSACPHKDYVYPW